MDELPLEILDTIAEDEQTYRGMLSIPYFARTIIPTRRIDFMIKFGHSIYIDKCKIVWTRNNKYHRLDGPAVEYAWGGKEWFVNGKRHRLDRPALEYSDGYKAWYINGRLHREDGPTIEYVNGTKKWYIDDKLHRLNGPAIEFLNGDKQWYVDGKCLSEEEFKQLMKSSTIQITKL